MMPSFPKSLWLLGASVALAAACGGKAVIDPPAGAGGATSSSTTSQGASDVGVVSIGVGTTTSTGMDCTCATDAECPSLDDACFEFRCDGCQCVETPLPAGAACMQGVCDGASNCVECLEDDDCLDGQCIDQICSGETVEGVCNTICTSLDACVMDPNSGCTEGCLPALQDCSAAELEQLLDCNDFLDPLCDVPTASNCIAAVACTNN